MRQMAMLQRGQVESNLGESRRAASKRWVTNLGPPLTNDARR